MDAADMMDNWYTMNEYDSEPDDSAWCCERCCQRRGTRQTVIKAHDILCIECFLELLDGSDDATQEVYCVS